MSILSSQAIELTGIITRSFSARGSIISTVTDGSSAFEVVSSEPLAMGSAVKVSGALIEVGDKMQIKADKITRFDDAESKKIISRIENKINEKVAVSYVPLFVPDSVTEKLKPAIYSVAKKILSAKALNRFILLRFHGDADGISGAFALTEITKMHSIQQNSAVYSVGEAIRDLQLFHHEFMPLVILLDFSSSDESAAGLRLLKAAGVEVIIIDHHPPEDKGAITAMANLFLSPWTVSENEEDVSRYTAGYLAVEVARAAGVGEEKVSESLAKISCAGDKSTILDISAEDRDKALVLDYMASYSSFGNNLEFYAGVIKKPELFSSMLFQAREKIEQIFETVRKTLREKEINGIKIAIIDLEKISKKHEFPSKGKIATRVFESMNSDAESPNPLVVLGYGEKSVVFRINSAAVELGVSADKIISELKTTMKDFVESGGGHACAASVRVREGYAKDVIEEIIRSVEMA